MDGLHAILRPAWRRFLSGQPHLAWEVVAESDSISFSLWVPRTISPGLVERAVESAWPGAKTEIGADVALPALPGHVAITELTLAEPDWFPIGSELDTEPLRLALGSMLALDTCERAVIQVLARPATSAARYRLLRAARHLKRARPQALQFWASGAGARQASATRPATDPIVDPDVRSILAKASSPLWRCAVRVAVTSPRRPQARGKIHALAGAFAVFEGRNGFRRSRMLGGSRRLADRRLAGGYLLAVPEIAQIAALPAEAIPGLDTARARTLAPPRELPREGIVLGLSEHTGLLAGIDAEVLGHDPISFRM